MAKCYLMMEDGPDGMEFGCDFGVTPEDLPQDVNDLTEAQYTTHKFMGVLRQMLNNAEKIKQRNEIANTIVVPDHIANG